MTFKKLLRWRHSDWYLTIQAAPFSNLTVTSTQTWGADTLPWMRLTGDRRHLTKCLCPITLPSLLWNQSCCIWTCFAPSLPTGFTNSHCPPPPSPHSSLSIFLTVTYTYTVGHFSGGRLLSLQPGRMQTWRGPLCSRGLCTCQSICKRESTSETCTTRKPFPRSHTRSKARVLIEYQSTAARFSSNAFVWGRIDPAQHKHCYNMHAHT